LKLIEKQEENCEKILTLMHLSKQKLTPIDIAGLHHSDKAAVIILEFFCKKFHLIESAFEVKTKPRSKPWHLKIINRKKLEKK
jgi:hypothetical protein